MSDIILLKLGGSVLTDKSKPGAIRNSVISSIAAIIAKARITLLLIHGAGSCGHPEAMDYRIMEGVTRENFKGILTTHEAVSKLNSEVVNALQVAGVPALGIAPLTFCISEDRELISCDPSAIQKLIEIGITPVIHGDVVMDRKLGATVISGDQLISFIAPRIGAFRVGLATDVEGVLSEGVVVPIISRANLTQISIKGSVNTDVTGGMQGKVNELLKLADSGVTSNIFHISRISDFLFGLPHGGTIIRSELKNG